VKFISELWRAGAQKFCKATPPVEARRRQTRAPTVGLLGTNLTAVRHRLVEKDEYEGVAGLRD